MTEKEFIQKVAHNLLNYCDTQPQRPYIVAVSGGADSVALLVALNDLGCECIAAHSNYHLRGDESNRDMKSVQNLCSKLGIDLYVRDFDVEKRRVQTGESVEMACRELRYRWFDDLLDRQRAQAIAVAHHSEDNVETFFLNLMRGSGIAGLSGMKWRNGYVIRPLLDFSRLDIEEFLQSRNIDFVVDSTNAQNIFARNRLRNVIVPYIEEQFPGATARIVNSLNLLSQNRELYEDLIHEKRAKYLNSNQLDLNSLIKSERYPRTLLFELLHPLGFNITQIDNILASSTRSGLTFTTESIKIELDRGILYIFQMSENGPASSSFPVCLTRDILAPAHILISEHPITDFKPERDPYVAYFDIEILEGTPNFEIRHWQRGDKIWPYGMNSDKLVSDLFVNAKYSAQDKRNAWVLVRNGEVIWVLGLRASSKYSIKPETKRYLRLQFRK